MKTRLASVLWSGTLALVLAGCSSPQARTDVTRVSAPTSLMQAAGQGDLARVQQLMNQGESVNAVSDSGTALTEAAANGKRETMLALLRAGANPNLGVAEGQSSPLHHAAAAGDVPALRVLIAAGANLEHRDGEGLTPVAVAVRGGSLPTINALIQAGADINAVMDGRSLLMQAVELNSLLMAQILIRAGADVNFRSQTGMTALTIARDRQLGDLEMLLVQSGARS